MTVALPNLGSLCTGAAGLDLAVQSLLSAQPAWHAEIDPAAARVLHHRYPHVPNHGDLTAVNWTRVEQVDILAAGYPCQPFSAAGRRLGEADERYIVPAILHAIRVLRPRLVLLENVRGHLGRGFARVVAELAAIGYVGSWACVRASDVGAPHRRERLFVAAWPQGQPPHDLTGTPGDRGGADPVRPDRLTLLPTPRATDGTKGGPNQRGSSGDLMLPSAVMLLPTPTATPYGNNQSPSAGAAARPSLNSLASTGGLPTESLLPTPTVADSRGSRNATAGRSDAASDSWNPGWSLSDVAYADRWGDYAPAIHRWEHATGRPAPDPTEPGAKGQPRLSPRFVEWLMGWPDGWVTSVPGLTRTQQLRICGNGVVPQQAAAAYRQLLHAIAREVAA